MDRQDYINKSNNPLNQPTYRAISWDPSNTIKNKLFNILKRVKNQTGLDGVTYKSMYPTGYVPPKFYGLPKINKLDTPLRPIVSSCGSVTYGVAKELTKTLKSSVLRKALTQCKYPKWALDKVEERLNKPPREVSDEG